MNELDWLKSQDHAPPAPRLDVAGAVLREIRRREDASTPALPWLAAVVASLAGAGSAALALQVWLAAQDPLSELLDSFRLVLQ